MEASEANTNINIKKEPDKKEKQQITKREAAEVPKPKVVQDLNSSEKKINPSGDTIPHQPQQAHPNPSSQQSPPSQTDSQPAAQTDPFMMSMMELLKQTKASVDQNRATVKAKVEETNVKIDA